MQEDSKRTAEQAAEIVTLTGGKENILYAINCMTRVRITTRDNGRIDDDGLKALDYVLKVVHDRDNYVEVVVGPGKSHELVEEMRTMGIPDSLQEDADDLPAKTKKNENGDTKKAMPNESRHSFLLVRPQGLEPWTH